DTRRSVLGVLALEQLGRARDVLDNLDAASDLAERVRDDLAVLRSQDGGEVFTTLHEQVAVREQNRLALRERRLGPRLLGCLRRGNSNVDVVDRAQSNLLRHLSRGRVVDGRRAIAR